MKKAIAILLTALLLAAAVGCGGSGKPRGEYSSGIYHLSFSGDKVTLHIGNGGSSDVYSYGTFTLEGDNVVCTYESGLADTFIYDAKNETLDWMGLILFEKD